MGGTIRVNKKGMPRRVDEDPTNADDEEVKTLAEVASFMGLV